MKSGRLFTNISVEVGFMLPFDAVERLTGWLDEGPPPTVDAFTDEILRAEGIDPVLGDSGLRAQVRTLVAKEMGEPEWPPPKGRRGRRRRR